MVNAPFAVFPSILVSPAEDSNPFVRFGQDFSKKAKVRASGPRFGLLQKVKTTGVAGGLHKPYKGVGQPRLKAHEKVRQSQHYYGLPPYRGRLFICPCLLAHP